MHLGTEVNNLNDFVSGPMVGPFKVTKFQVYEWVLCSSLACIQSPSGLCHWTFPDKQCYSGEQWWILELWAPVPPSMWWKPRLPRRHTCVYVDSLQFPTVTGVALSLLSHGPSSLMYPISSQSAKMVLFTLWLWGWCIKLTRSLVI